MHVSILRRNKVLSCLFIISYIYGALENVTASLFVYIVRNYIKWDHVYWITRGRRRKNVWVKKPKFLENRYQNGNIEPTTATLSTNPVTCPSHWAHQNHARTEISSVFRGACGHAPPPPPLGKSELKKSNYSYSYSYFFKKVTSYSYSYFFKKSN